MLCSEMQSTKVESSIEVRFSERVMLVNDEAPENASAPSEVTLFGIVMLVNKPA